MCVFCCDLAADGGDGADALTLNIHASATKVIVWCRGQHGKGRGRGRRSGSGVILLTSHAGGSGGGGDGRQ